MTRTRMLLNPSTGRHWGTRLEGADLVILSGAPGKEKERRTTHPDVMTARATAEQEERKRLRKDFILVDDDPAPGDPSMLRALDRSYTGALPLLAVGDVLMCTSEVSDGAEIVLVDEGAELELVAKLEPNKHVPKLVGRADLGFLALVDHAVSMVSPNRGTVEELIAAGSAPASFLTLAGTRAGWFDEPDLVVADLASGEDLFRRPVEPVLYAGHSLQLQAELSPDGALLAVCSEPGAITVFDVDTQELSHTITGDFQMVNELHFTPDGQWLLVKERYGSWTLLCFDAATGTPREDWPDLGDLGDARVAVDAEGSRVAIADQRSWLRVLDFDSLQWQQEFQVDQVSKSFAVTWLGREQIATRTDLGFVGLYAVPAM